MRCPAASIGLKIGALTVIMVLAAYGPTYASVMIDGTVQKVVIEVDQEPLPTVLEALSARFGVVIETPAPVTGATVRGRFSGSITEVIKKLLSDYDLVIRTRHDAPPSIEVIVVGRSNHNPTPYTAQSRPASASQWDGR